MVDIKAARNNLYERMKAVFSDECFGSLFPGSTVPDVFLGFPVNEPPFYIAVDEIPEGVSNDASVSMGHSEATFDLNIWLCSTHRNLLTVADSLIDYECTIIDAICADQTLGRTVDIAFPRVSDTGTAANPSKRYIGAANITVTCSKFSNCPNQIKEIVDAVNRNN